MKLDSTKTIFLIDASSFLYRAYYSMRPLQTPEGEAVQAVYGFCRMIKKLIDMFDPQYCALVWDSKGKTTRHDMYEAYKATRDAPPSDLFIQKERIIQCADAIGCLQVSQQGIEADDLMYSIAQDYAQKGYRVVLVTSDKDMGQAITDAIVMYDPSKDIMYDAQTYQEKVGVAVDRLPLYFSLLGDASDNIPGVRGVGKKGAQEIATQLGSLQELYDNLDVVEKKRTRTALEAHKDDAFLSHDLFLLQYHKTGVTLDDLSFNKKNWMQALPLFKELHFRSLIQESASIGMTVQDKVAYWKEKYNFILVTTQQQLNELCAEIERSKAFALDTETNGVRSLQAELVGLSICMQEGIAYYVPCAHQAGDFIPRDAVVKMLRPYLEDATYKKYLHNTKFDQKVFWAHGIDLKGVAHDTLVAASLIAQDGQKVGLKFLSMQHFNEPMLSYADMVTVHGYKGFSYVPIEDAVWYAAADAHQTFKLVNVVEKGLQKEQMESLYHDLELPMTQVLYYMEREGIYCDTTVLDTLRVYADKVLTECQEQIQQQAGLLIPINLNSPKQVQDLLFNQLKLPPQKKSSKGGYSTDQSVLAELAKMHSVPKLIMQYREYAKLKNTYIDALPHYVNPKTGRIHTSYNQVAVSTGRLSSVEPNLQNIPLDGELSIRSAFKPKEGHCFVSADYSQIELRVLAHLSQDKTLMNAFTHNRDIHKETASGLFSVAVDAVTSEQRQIGKRINFSVLYGMTPYGLSRDLDIPFAQAKEYIDKYFNTYPGVLAWMESTVAFAVTHGYVQTHWGRRRYIPAIYEKNKALYQEAQRAAINTVAQGTASELMKKGMVLLQQAFDERNHDEHVLLQIHDELLVTTPEKRSEETAAFVSSVLETVVSWSIPLNVTVRSGRTWQEVSK